jgi:hypothetical protein
LEEQYMKARQASYVQMVSHATSAEAIPARDQLEFSANLLNVANVMPDYDQAKHAYDLARRCHENAARNLLSGDAALEQSGLTDEFHDLDMRLTEFERDLASHSNWSERPSGDDLAARGNLRTGAFELRV